MVFTHTVLQTNGRRARVGGVRAALHHAVFCNQCHGHQYKCTGTCIQYELKYPWMKKTVVIACIKWKHRIWFKAGLSVLILDWCYVFDCSEIIMLLKITDVQISSVLVPQCIQMAHDAFRWPVSPRLPSRQE